MGTDSDEARMRESQKLLSYGFRYFETQSLYQAQISLRDQPVYYGELESVSLGVAEDVVVTFPRGYYKDVEAELTIPKVVEAPLRKGDQVGELSLRLSGDTIFQTPLIALEDVPETGLLGRLGDFFGLFFDQLFSSD